MYDIFTKNNKYFYITWTFPTLDSVEGNENITHDKACITWYVALMPELNLYRHLVFIMQVILYN